MAENPGKPRRGGAVVAVVLVLLAVAAGGAAGWELGRRPGRLADAAPVAAVSPAVPSWAPYAVDSTAPPLATGLTYQHEKTIDSGANRWLVDLPTGWVIVKDPSNTPGSEASFKPRDALHAGYKLRVKGLHTDLTPTQMRDQRIDQVSGLANFTLAGTTSDSVDFTYRLETENLQRRNLVRWIAAPGQTSAGLEVAVSGRMIDKAGLDALLAHVADSAQPAPQ